MIGVASVTATELPDATYIYPNKIYYAIGEDVIVTSNGSYDALETPNGVLSYVDDKWDGQKLVMTWKAEKSGTVKFYNKNTSVLIKVAIDKPTPMFSFMKILGFGKKNKSFLFSLINILYFNFFLGIMPLIILIF